MATSQFPLLKMNGAGNKILVADTRALPNDKKMTGKRAATFGKQDFLHFDQMMVIEPSKTENTSAFVSIFNIDGTIAEACGNGTRCVADILMHETNTKGITIETVAGLLDCTRIAEDQIRVDMGEPRFEWDAIPLAEEFRDTRAIELQVGPIDAPVLHSPSVANMGNPHAIFFVDNDVETYGLERFGPLLERHPVFPEGANISLAKINTPNDITLKVWERGAGLTLACGSAACAALACAARTKRTGRSANVHLPGGTLHIEWTDQNRILMTGPIAYEAVGVADNSTLDWDMVETTNPFGQTA